MDLSKKIVKIVENLININKNKLSNQEINENIINSFSSDLTPLELNYLNNKYTIPTISSSTINQNPNVLYESNNEDSYEPPSKRRKM
jgi:hypothetical protein